MTTDKQTHDEKPNVASSEMNLGQIIKDAGDFGRFQFLLTGFISLVLVILTWSMLAMSFAAAIPNWTCAVYTSGDIVKDNVSAENVCDVNGTKCDEFVFDPNMKTIVSEWNLVCDQKWIPQTVTTVQMVGLLSGGLFWGHVSDGIGRKPTFFLNIALLGVSNLVSYFSTNWQMFASMRFFIGLACSGFMVSNITFEYYRNNWRVYLNLIPSWALWAAAMAGVTYLKPDWHIIHLIVAVMSFLSLGLWFFLPESFRWLVSHGKLDEAERAINHVARINGAPPSNLTNLRKVVENEQRLAEKEKSLQVYTVIDLFRSSQVRKVTLLFSLIWMFSAFAYYGIAFGVQELSGNLYMNLFLVSIVDIPGNYVLVLFNRWFGRRFTCVVFYILGGGLALAVGIIQFIKIGSGLTINILAFSSKLCINAAWTMNTLWSSESFPTVVRNIGGGMLSSVSRIGSIIAPQVISLSTDTPGLLYLGSGAVCLMSSFLCYFLEETKYKDLPDMLPHKRDKSETEKNKVLNVV